MNEKLGKRPGRDASSTGRVSANSEAQDRRRLKRRATDPELAEPTGKAAAEKTRPDAVERKSAPLKVKRNVNGARTGYDPYESGQLVKPSNPGVRRDLRSLGQWLKAGKKPGQ